MCLWLWKSCESISRYMTEDSGFSSPQSPSVACYSTIRGKVPSHLPSMSHFEKVKSEADRRLARFLFEYKRDTQIYLRHTNRCREGLSLAAHPSNHRCCEFVITLVVSYLEATLLITSFSHGKKFFFDLNTMEPLNSHK